MAATVETVVSPEMTARLGGRRVHPVLGTAPLIEWLEWAGRKLILPYLEPGEDAVGYRIEFVHLCPLGVGERFTATAEFQHQEGNRVMAAVYADAVPGRLGQGVFTQVVLSQHALAARLTRAGIRRPDDLPRKD
jgi:predicted thioesterase